MTNTLLLHNFTYFYVAKEDLKVYNLVNPPTGNPDTFIVEVSSAEESRRMRSFQKICQQDITIQVNDSNNVQKGLAFVQVYDMLDIDNHKKGLQSQHNLGCVEHAHWIKTNEK